MQIRLDRLLFGLFLFGCLIWLHPAGAATALEIDCRGPEPVWSASEPPVNLTHIFCGEINSRGRPVGFHARPNALGIYTAEVAVRRPVASWQTADEKFSSFFPDSMAPQEVLDAVLAAFRAAEDREGKWRGDPGLGFVIEGWLLPNGRRINTAWPVFVDDRP